MRVFIQGEAKSKSAKSTINSSSGFNVLVGEAEFDNLMDQIQQAKQFLSENKTELQQLGQISGLELCLDFGISDRDVAAQTDTFPCELLEAMGKLKLDLQITRYPQNDDLN